MKNGYGKTGLHNHFPTRLAHRTSYLIHCGPLPDGMFACHTCDNRKCCNPTHLFAGTAKDNADDRTRKGKSIAGERTNRLFTEECVRILLHLRMMGFIRWKELASILGVRDKSLRDLVYRQSFCRVQIDGYLRP